MKNFIFKAEFTAIYCKLDPKFQFFLQNLEQFMYIFIALKVRNPDILRREEVVNNWKKGEFQFGLVKISQSLEY